MQIVNGTYYLDETPRDLIDVFEHIRQERIRVKITYRKFTTTCYIGRTVGPKKCLIELHNARSPGGPLLYEKDIQYIDYSNKRKGGRLYSKS